MWYLLTIILAIIGAFVAWAGEPMGATLFIPLIVTGVWYEFKGTTK
jgi:mannose/fructose/N-acetylgalactosamine-specific phosphotransferase system component IID